MSKVVCSPSSRKRRKRVLDRAKGFRGSRSKLIRTAYDAVDRANAMAYTGRKQKKRQYRRLWTIRINAACRLNGINYSQFIYGLKLASIQLNRKVLSEIAINDPDSFKSLVSKARKAIPNTK